jgi:hypothetical protein
MDDMVSELSRLPVSQISQMLQRDLNLTTPPMYLPDIATDPSPSHIVGPVIFVCERALRRQVAKLGRASIIRNEAESIRDASTRLSSLKSRTFPEIAVVELIEVVDTSFEELSILITAFHGFHNLESCRGCHLMELLQSVLNALRHADIFWPGIMARNVIVEDSTFQSLTLLDWELGFVSIDAIKHSITTYIRSMQLLEEFSSFSRNCIPYWCKEWPNVNELLAHQGSSCVAIDVQVEETHDPRLVELLNLLKLPHVLTDAQLFRAIFLLSSVCDGEPMRHFTLYAVDHLANWLGFQFHSRLACIFFVLNHLSPERSTLLRREVVAAACELVHGWRVETDSQMPMQMAITIQHRLEQTIDKLGTGLGNGTQWMEYVLIIARDFIMQRRGHEGFSVTVLCEV